MNVCKLNSTRLSVALDIRQPQAFLALHAAAASVEVNWLPIAVSPLKPPSAPSDSDDRGVRHRRYRAEAIAREIETYAEVQGLTIREYYRGPDSTPFNLAWLWLRENHPESLFSLLTAAFRAYWNLELDPSNDSAIARLLEDLGLDGAACLSWARDDGTSLFESVSAELRAAGLARSPCYVVDGEIFVGRQHWPMIRWILAGRLGRGPI